MAQASAGKTFGQEYDALPGEPCFCANWFERLPGPG
jgi:hypothetical protein